MLPGSMQRRRRRLLVPALLVALTGSVATPPGSAQTPPPTPATPATEAAPYTSPAPPPAENALFPAPGAASRPAPPPVPDNQNLRRARKENGRRGRRAGTEGGAFGAGPKRQAANPALLTAAADPVEIRIAYRRAETEAKRDPIFIDLLRRADLARDDEERRALLRRYYTELFVRVRQLDRSPTLAAHVAVLSRAAEQRYAPKRKAGGVDENELGRIGGKKR